MRRGFFQIVALFRRRAILGGATLYAPCLLCERVPSAGGVPSRAHTSPCGGANRDSATAAVCLGPNLAAPTGAIIPTGEGGFSAAGPIGARIYLRAACSTVSAVGAEHQRSAPVSQHWTSVGKIGISFHRITQVKTGTAVRLSFGLAPLLFPLCFSPFLSFSIAAASVQYPSLPGSRPTSRRASVPRKSTYLAATRWYPTISTSAGTSRSVAALVPYTVQPTAFYSSFPTTQIEAPDTGSSRVAVSRSPPTVFNKCADCYEGNKRSISSYSSFPATKVTSISSTSRSEHIIDNTTSRRPGAQVSHSRCRPSFWLDIHSSVPSPHCSVASQSRSIQLPVAAVTAALSTSTARTTSLKGASFLQTDRRDETMATMGGFNPKDPEQAADVVLVPVLSDNYAYLLIDRESKKAACVDPAEPEKPAERAEAHEATVDIVQLENVSWPEAAKFFVFVLVGLGCAQVLQAAKKEGVELSLCLCTHRHHDHAGGNVELAKMVPGICIVGSAYEDTPGATKRMRDKDTLDLGDLRIEALHAPCHTCGHLLYYVTNSKQPTLAPILFSGDTLFIGGCGRFFEGTAQQMHHALIDICGSLPPNTRVYCGHEYTEANLQFASTVEGDNKDLAAKLAWAKDQRTKHLPTVPSTLAQV